MLSRSGIVDLLRFLQRLMASWEDEDLMPFNHSADNLAHHLRLHLPYVILYIWWAVQDHMLHK